MSFRFAVALASLPLALAYASDVPHIQGHLGDDNPYMASGGAGAMHGDAYASDATPMPGPGTDTVSVINGPTLSGPTDPYANLANRPCGMLWREEYDRGTSVKLGQLTRGSGSTQRRCPGEPARLQGAPH